MKERILRDASQLIVKEETKMANDRTVRANFDFDRAESKPRVLRNERGYKERTSARGANAGTGEIFLPTLCR